MNTTILILAANPTDTAKLRLGEEVREIQDGLNKARNRDQYQLEQQWAVRPRDLQQAMLDYSPNIVHFCGHGSGTEGIAFEDDLGNTKLVQTSALADLFQIFAEEINIECVVLNACYSEVQARAIARHVPYVVGMNRAIGDKAAIEFAVAFYKAIGAGKDIEFAYKLGCNAIAMAGIPENLTPVLKHQGNITEALTKETPEKSVKLFNADLSQTLDSYIAEKLKSALHDNGYTLEIASRHNRTLSYKKTNGKTAPDSFFLVPRLTISAEEEQQIEEIISYAAPLFVLQNSIENYPESQQKLFNNQSVIQWQGPSDDATLIRKALDFLQSPYKPQETEDIELQRDLPPAQEPNSKIIPDLWLSFLLERKANLISSRWLQSETENTFTTDASMILPFLDTPQQRQTLSEILLGNLEQWQAQLQSLLSQANLTKWQDAKIRIRIMTDDPELAHLPWHKMEPKLETESTVEVSPLIFGYQPVFSEQTITTPLVVIPSAQEHNIRGDIHYRLVQEFLESYLDIRGAVTRTISIEELERELKFQNPDLLYIYAKYENGRLQLDPGNSGQTELSLNDLGSILEQAQLEGEDQIRPMVVLSLVGQELDEYPESLVKNSRLLWIQHTRRMGRLDDLGDNLADVLNALNNNPDIANIISHAHLNPKYDLNHHLWINGRSISIDLSNLPGKKDRQLRAALLKVMLGRKELKERMFSEIYRSELINNSTLLTYAVSGNEQACPFDVPAQLQQRLNFDDIELFLPVIPFYFHLTIDPQRDRFDAIDIALGQGILHGANDIDSIFYEELERRGLLNQDCCIALNWFFKISAKHKEQLLEWLTTWSEILCSDFMAAIPDNTVLVSAACIDIMDADIEADYQLIQDQANQVLHAQAQCPLHPIRIPEALGKLKAYEIEDFLRNNTHWRSELKVDEYQIDPYLFGQWIYQHTDGNFDSAVRAFWQQFQTEYQGFLKESS